MAYQAVSFGGFGAGLNLRDKADAVSEQEAIDALNVEFTERGAVQQRSGYAKLTSSALTNAAASLEGYYKTDGTKQLLAGCGTRLEAVNTSGAVVASASALSSGTWDFCRFGSPGSEVAYAGNGKNLLRKWDGSSWSSVANSPKARYLAVMAVDKGNRMVAAGFDDSSSAGPSASQAYTSYVWFSGAGTPETFGANDFQNLTPGDGEKIQNVVAFRDVVIVFKETKFFVFYGTSTDSSGNPVFNYTTIDTGVGLASPRAVAVAPNAVYFMSRDGVYRTTGGDPEQVSDMIDPIWTGAPSDYYTGGTIAHSVITNCAMTFHADRLYLAFSTASDNNRVLVYDPRYEWWSLWDLPAAALASFRIGDQAELVFAYSGGSNDIGRVSSAYTNDDGDAITSYWRSGWQDFGIPDEKVIRQSKVWGLGACTVSVSTDFSGSGFYGEGSSTWPLNFSEDRVTWETGTWETETWADPQRLKDRLARHAVKGTTFSTLLRNNVLDQPWAVHRLDHHLRNVEIPSKL